MFNNFKKSEKGKSKTDILNSVRAQMKKTMAQNLKNIGFTKEEIKEVIDIINETEKEIQFKKDALVGTNINNDHTEEIMKKTFYDIRQMELKMAEDIKAKIAEIKTKKANG